jgi:phosphoglycolate phosphatase
MLSQIRCIIWDWNGTLLDDVELCVHTINEMLDKRDLQTLSLSGYKDVFSFPVKNYYQKIGFDFRKEPFEIPALEFTERYNDQVIGCQLHEDSFRILSYFHSIGIRQFILSAMKQDILEECLNHYRISHFFEHVSGLDNHYAVSKLENGHRLISDLKLDVADLVLIGATVHDFEVANALGCPCILLANGHQSKEVLQATGAAVIDRLSQLTD